jgi:hypothetical protein
MRLQSVCRCSAYRFPHRSGGGECLDDGSGEFCGDCGRACRAIECDFGVGAYEFWGRTGVHRDVHVVSNCCEATVYADASLTEPLTH